MKYSSLPELNRVESRVELIRVNILTSRVILSQIIESSQVESILI